MEYVQKKSKVIAAFFLFTCFMAGTQADEIVKVVDGKKLTSEEKEKVSEESNCARLGGVLQFFIDNKTSLQGLSPNTFDSYKLAFDLVEGIANDTRADQTKMADIAHAIESFLFTLPETVETRTFKNEVFEFTRKIKSQTYRDTLFMNQNISRLIRCEGPRLLKDIALLSLKHKDVAVSGEEKSDRRIVFKHDLNELKEKFLGSRQFYIGIGASYAYIPSIFYRSKYDFDLSDFNPTIGNGGMTGISNTGSYFVDADFSNASYSALRITADIPWVSVDLMLSDSEEVATNSSSIRAENTGLDGQSVLWKTDITATLNLDYDIQARLSVRDIVDFTTDLMYGEDNDGKYSSPFEKLTAQIDFGFGVGATGFGIESQISTDFRIKNTPDVLFADLPSVETRVQTQNNSFRITYLNLFVDFEISDQWTASLEYRSYDDTESIDIDGNSLAFSFVYFVF